MKVTRRRLLATSAVAASVALPVALSDKGADAQGKKPDIPPGQLKKTPTAVTPGVPSPTATATATAEPPTSTPSPSPTATATATSVPPTDTPTPEPVPVEGQPVTYGSRTYGSFTYGAVL